MSWPIDPSAGLTALFARWNARCASMGQLALAALVVVVTTGVVLALGYDVAAPFDSLALSSLTSLVGRLVRGAHAWASHLIVLFTLLHGVEHVAARSDTRLPLAVWLRVVLSLPLLLAAAVTGFMLKADAEGALARQVVSGLLERLPAFGPSIATALLGAGDELQVVYLHHVGTLTLLVTVLAIEHGRRLWPTATSTLALAGLVTLFGLALPPVLHSGVEPVVKGPWTFVGLQEVLHWLAWPELLWLLLALPLGLLAALPTLGAAHRRRAVGLLFLLALLYLGLSVWAAAFRGAGWKVESPLGPELRTSRSPTSFWARPTFAAVDEAAVPPILGRREGCLACHAHVSGLSKSHAPEALGCSACHLGDPSAPDAAGAHRGMVRVPGNLDSAMLSCGGAGCHEGQVVRVQGTLMASLRGMIAVDRWVFGEAARPDGNATVADLGDTPADTHLKQLCVGCHLGTIKRDYGPATDASRGGGCAACHVTYPEHRDYAPDHADRFVHPDVSLQVRDEACFGCHSRSGRISLGYAGLWESGLSEAEAQALPQDQWQRLADGRILRRTTDDVHHAQGMACVDCHTAREVMGDGEVHLHEEQATRVRCETCHRVAPARSVAVTELPAEAAAIVRLRYGDRPPARLLLEDASGEPLTHAMPLADGNVELIGKLSGKHALAKPPAPSCRAIPGHERLSCRACHDTWVPRCPACHTQWDPTGTRRDELTGAEARGAWVEYDSPPAPGLPAFGVLERDGVAAIEPFAPGMISTLNLPGASVRSPLPAAATDLVGVDTRFTRAYALAVPHTTTRQGLSCAACHAESQAVGYGRGKLTLVDEGAARRWRFEATHAPLAQDGLAADAWVAPLDASRSGLTTRTTTRSLTIAEQARVLEVGACLACHEPTSPRGRTIYGDFRAARRRVTPACRVPAPPP